MTAAISIRGRPAAGLLALLGAAHGTCAETLVPLSQDRYTLTFVYTECEGATGDEEAAPGFASFQSAIQSFQQCDVQATFGRAAADQQSRIGPASITGAGSAFSAGEGLAGIHVFATSAFELTFALPGTTTFDLAGTLTTAGGHPGGLDARLRLTDAKDGTLVSHHVVGTGAEESRQIAEAGTLDRGVYTMLVYASISPADLLPLIPSSEASFDFTLLLLVPGDVNRDGVVNIADLVAVILGWGTCPDPPSDCSGDLNGDGVVDVLDLTTVLLNWG